MVIQTSTLLPKNPDKPTITFELKDSVTDKVVLPPVVIKRRFRGDMLGNIKSYIKDIKSTHDDDSIDRLNYVYTIYILLGLAITIFAKNYVGEPLQCWVPKQWTDTWEAFSESYCFVENTYFVSMNDTNLPAHQTREGKEMIYYQWVPFILTLMAFFFYLPRGVWKIFSVYSGLALSDMMTAARNSAKQIGGNKKLDELANTMQTRSVRPAAGATLRYGSSLFNLYILMKVLIWLNLLLQFFFLNHFLGTGYVLWGIGILRDLLNGRQWQESGHFPRVAFCDLTVREMGNVNNWTVQCVLMVNMFNEKIFLLLWWWFAGVLIATSINLFIWFLARAIPNKRRSFIHTLHAAADLPKDAGYQHRMDAFFTTVLKDDGVLVLRLLDSNGGRLQSVDLFKKLWLSKYPIVPEIQLDEFDSSDEKQRLLSPTEMLNNTLTTLADDEDLLNEHLWKENYPNAPNASNDL